MTSARRNALGQRQIEILRRPAANTVVSRRRLVQSLGIDPGLLESDSLTPDRDVLGFQPASLIVTFGPGSVATDDAPPRHVPRVK